MQCRYLVVKIVAAFIKSANGCGQRCTDEFLVNDLNASVFCHRGGDFQSVQEASRVTVSKSDEDFLGLFIYFKARILSFKSSLKQLF